MHRVLEVEILLLEEATVWEPEQFSLHVHKEEENWIEEFGKTKDMASILQSTLKLI